MRRDVLPRFCFIPHPSAFFPLFNIYKYHHFVKYPLTLSLKY